MSKHKIPPNSHKATKTNLRHVIKKQKENQVTQPFLQRLSNSLSSTPAQHLKIYPTENKEEQFNRNLKNKQLDIMVYISSIINKQEKDVDIQTTYNQRLKQFQFTLTKTGKTLGLKTTRYFILNEQGEFLKKTKKFEFNENKNTINSKYNIDASTKGIYIFDKLYKCCTTDNYFCTSEMKQTLSPDIKDETSQQEVTAPKLSQNLETMWLTLIDHFSQQQITLTTDKKVNLINPEEDLDKLIQTNIQHKLSQQQNLTVHSITFKDNQIQLEINRHSNNIFGKFINLFRKNKIVTIDKNTPLNLSRLQNPLSLYNEISSIYKSYTLAQNTTTRNLFEQIKKEFNSIDQEPGKQKKMEKKFTIFLESLPSSSNSLHTKTLDLLSKEENSPFQIFMIKFIKNQNIIQDKKNKLLHFNFTTNSTDDFKKNLFELIDVNDNDFFDEIMISATPNSKEKEDRLTNIMEFQTTLNNFLAFKETLNYLKQQINAPDITINLDEIFKDIILNKEELEALAAITTTNETTQKNLEDFITKKDNELNQKILDNILAPNNNDISIEQIIDYARFCSQINLSEKQNQKLNELLNNMEIKDLLESHKQLFDTKLSTEGTKFKIKLFKIIGNKIREAHINFPIQHFFKKNILQMCTQNHSQNNIQLLNLAPQDLKQVAQLANIEKQPEIEEFFQQSCLYSQQKESHLKIPDFINAQASYKFNSIFYLRQDYKSYDLNTFLTGITGWNNSEEIKSELKFTIKNKLSKTLSNLKISMPESLQSEFIKQYPLGQKIDSNELKKFLLTYEKTKSTDNRSDKEKIQFFFQNHAYFPEFQESEYTFYKQFISPLRLIYNDIIELKNNEVTMKQTIPNDETLMRITGLGNSDSFYALKKNLQQT